MFLYCEHVRRICAMAGKYKGELYCGYASGENRIRLLKQCPCKKIRERYLKLDKNQSIK